MHQLDTVPYQLLIFWVISGYGFVINVDSQGHYLSDFATCPCASCKKIKLEVWYIKHTCDWSRVDTSGSDLGSVWWLAFVDGFSCLGLSSCMHLGAVVISVTMHQGFMDKCKAAWPAKQRMSVEDSEISIELWWTSYLFIQIVLRWSVHCHGTTGVSCSHIGWEGCLSETCHHMTVMRTCSAVKLPSCPIDMETHCERRLEKG